MTNQRVFGYCVDFIPRSSQGGAPQALLYKKHTANLDLKTGNETHK